jgi:hypothetical protein
LTNYRKLDAALAGALARALEAGRPLNVFVHVDPDSADALGELGVDLGNVQEGIATATLPAEQIASLSEQPWVRQIRLSSPLRLLDDQ